MKDTVIKVENVSEYAAIISLLFNYGYRHYDGRKFETLTKEWGNGVVAEYSWVFIDNWEETFSGYRKNTHHSGLNYDFLSFVEGLAFLTDPEKKIGKIDIGDYKECVYNKKEISVGCQTIPFETIEKLYNGMKALKN
jgi:hypothetical protein